MCEIQVIFNLNKENLTDKDVNEFDKLMCFGSMHNKDAFGVFNSRYSFKDNGIFKSHKLDKKQIKSDYFIVGHNRLATSGFGEGKQEQTFWETACNSFLQSVTMNFYMPIMPGVHFIPLGTKNQEMLNTNNHPFELGDFILVHNGIIHNASNIRYRYGISSQVETDSFVILYLVNKFFNQSNKKTRELKIAEAIERTCNQLEGSYSVFLLDKQSNQLFYFKDEYTRFNIYKINNLLVGSTEKENIKYVYSGDRRERLDIIDKCIYTFSADKSNPVRVIKNMKYKDSDMDKISNSLFKILGFYPDIKINGNYIIMQDDDKIIKERLNKLKYRKIGFLITKYELPINQFKSIKEKGGKEK